MKLLKRHWFSVLITVVCAALVFTTVKLRGDLTRLHVQVDIIRDLQREDKNAIRALEAKIAELEQGAELIAGYELQPAGIDAERKTLLADMVLTLRQWTADTSVELHVFVGEEWTYSFPAVESGVCRGRVELPIENSESLRMVASVTSGGVTTREEVGSWWDIASLLPVQLSGFGGATPRYEDGMVQLHHYQADLFDGQDRYGIRVREPEFRMYLNDIPVQTQPGTEQEDGGLVQYECLIEPMTCEPGDTFRMTFTCRDEFGLAYEFTLGLWSIPEEEGRLEELPAEEPHRPVLIWD